MTTHRILIVDDQREVTRVLKSSLESLELDGHGHKFDIDTVLSGEEAMLEIARIEYHLLVSDVRLPGITGLELMQRFKDRNPDGKVLLISGVTDQKIRQEVAHAGADAFFFKPIEIADFLDSVERILGMVDTVLPNEMELVREEEPDIDEEQEATGMGDRITQLREEIKAEAVLLISDIGQILVRSGALPDKAIETDLMSHLMSAFGAAVNTSQALGNATPRNLLSFHNSAYDLYLAPVGDAYALLIATPPGGPKGTAVVAPAAAAAAGDVALNLSHMGVATTTREQIKKDTGSLQAKPAEQAPPPEDLSDPELEGLFEAKPDADVTKTDADAFWDSFADEEIQAELPSGDSLTYDQAMQLGLAPSDE